MTTTDNARARLRARLHDVEAAEEAIGGKVNRFLFDVNDVRALVNETCDHGSYWVDEWGMRHCLTCPNVASAESTPDAINKTPILGQTTDDTEWEYGFYDSADPNDPAKVWTHCFGLPFKDADQAKHTGDKNAYGQTVVVRRERGTEQWEPIDLERP